MVNVNCGGVVPQQAAKIKRLEAEVERLKARECYAVMDYDHIAYAGYDMETLEGIWERASVEKRKVEIQ